MHFFFEPPFFNQLCEIYKQRLLFLSLIVEVLVTQCTAVGASAALGCGTMGIAV